MKFKVVFSIDAADELLSIIGKVDAVSVLSASETIRRALESDHAKFGNELSEGLWYIDREPLRAFFVVRVELGIVEVTDFRWF